MDIKEKNTQIMIKMIIDKLHNETLKEYYKKLSKRGEKIEKQGQEILGQRGEISVRDQKIEVQRGSPREEPRLSPEDWPPLPPPAPNPRLWRQARKIEGQRELET